MTINKQLQEAADQRGLTFGYIGNCGGIPDTPGWFDDRSWSFFAPHPGRVGKWDDRFGNVPTDNLDTLLTKVENGDLDRWLARRMERSSLDQLI